MQDIKESMQKLTHKSNFCTEWYLGLNTPTAYLRLWQGMKKQVLLFQSTSDLKLQ